MPTSPPEPTQSRSDDLRPRNAADTQNRLLDAARRQFARNGYSGTTVRDIAAEAEVNVALISRYFRSKEGLFAACLTGAVDELDDTMTADVSLADLPLTIARHLAESDTDGLPTRLLLLLRSSGDEGADRIRLDVLKTFSVRLATLTGGGEAALLNAQVVLAASLGITVLRSSVGLEPLASAGEQELLVPLDALIAALLPPASGLSKDS
jgi:AcrR family transcriptional regulator